MASSKRHTHSLQRREAWRVDGAVISRSGFNPWSRIFKYCVKVNLILIILLLLMIHILQDFLVNLKYSLQNY